MNKNTWESLNPGTTFDNSTWEDFKSGSAILTDSAGKPLYAFDKIHTHSSNATVTLASALN